MFLLFSEIKWLIYLTFLFRIKWQAYSYSCAEFKYVFISSYVLTGMQL